VELIGCRVTGLDLTEASATSLVLRDCVGSLASFRFANLKRARFEDCGLTEADFLNAVLTEVVFRRCDLKNAVFHGTRASGADLRGCALDDLRIGPADLAGTVIDPIQLVALARRLAANQGIVVRALDDDGVA